MNLFERQLQAVNQDSKVYSDCIEITRLHSTMLVDCGLDFKELKDPRLRARKDDGAPGLGLK